MWVQSSSYLYEEGDIFLGEDNSGLELGIRTPRHAITFAGSRSGKGAACIIPNLKRWPHNSLTIDPKGEAALETAADRQSMGQLVHVIEPFREIKSLKKYRASYNPLDELDVNALTISADINVIAEGLMMRHDPKHGRWDNKAKLIIAGLISFVKMHAPEGKKNLIEVRNILRTSDMATLADNMMEYSECDGLMQAAAAAIKSPDGKDFIDTAQANTEWLDVKAFADCMSHSDFSMFDLKSGRASIYLVLPPDYLDEYGRFLRLFVRIALGQMSKKLDDGRLLGKRCLFILDEFYSLGHLKIIQTASGQMPGMGVHLWPFLQDLGQLTSLYGKEGADTFFGNADLHQFFANTDQTTLRYMSEVSGTVSMRDAGAPPSAIEQQHQANPLSKAAAASSGGMVRTTGVIVGAIKDASLQQTNTKEQALYETEKNFYAQRAARIGHKKYTTDEMAEFVQRKEDDVANLMFCVCNGADRLFIKPKPYYRDFVVYTKDEITRQENNLDAHIAEKTKNFNWNVPWTTNFLIAFIPATILHVILSLSFHSKENPNTLTSLIIYIAIAYYPAKWICKKLKEEEYNAFVEELSEEFNKTNH